MSLRGWVVSRLENDANIIAIVPIDRIMSSGAVGLPNTPTEEPARPFIVVRGNADENRINAARSQRFQVWVHDNVGSYVRIENLLEMVRAALEPTMPHTVGSTRVTSVEWEGGSDDLFDDTFGTGTRFAQFRLTGRQVGS